MSRLSVTLNGWNCSHLFNKWGTFCYDIKVEGPNSGISQGGTRIVDLVRTKDGFRLEGNSVGYEDYKRLRAMCRQAYLTAVIREIPEGEGVPKTMIPTLSEANRKVMSGGKIYYDGWTLTLEER